MVMAWLTSKNLPGHILTMLSWHLTWGTRGTPSIVLKVVPALTMEARAMASGPRAFSGRGDSRQSWFTAMPMQSRFLRLPVGRFPTCGVTTSTGSI